MVQNQVLFDRYIAVDWSASARPSPKGAKNSIWIAVLNPSGQPVNGAPEMAHVAAIGAL